jgi:aspartate kinase
VLVLKFGGTSVATPEALRNVLAIVRRQRERGAVVVVSAAAGTTDQLIAAAERARAGDAAAASGAAAGLEARHLELAGAVLDGSPAARHELEHTVREVCARLARTLENAAARRELSPRTRDEVLAAGEDLSVRILTAALRVSGCPAEWLDARRLVWTDERFGNATPLTGRIADAVRAELLPRARSAVIVTQGFVGAAAPGVTTTLGRGGSDTTAALLGAALRAEEIQIWTDVDGILSADPRVVPAARIVPEIGFEEAIELAYFGAKVLHPAAAKHAAAAGVPLRVLNTLNPDSPGTLVRPDVRGGAGVAAVAFRTDTALVSVRSLPMFMAHGFLSRVFETVARHRLAVDLVATSHTSTAFTVGDDPTLETVLAELRPFCEMSVEHGLATFSVIGRGLLHEVGISARVFSALDHLGVRMITQASDISLNFLVEASEAPRCARRLHEVLIEGRQQNR